MSVTINSLLYTKIDSLTARVGYGYHREPNALPYTYSGEVKILSYVTIDSLALKVVEIGASAFYTCTLVTRIVIPNTVTTLKQWCFRKLTSLKEIIIPSSVTVVESYFITLFVPERIIFCGIKEPKMVNSNGADVYIHQDFKANVIVLSNYDIVKSTFLQKGITRNSNLGQYCLNDNHQRTSNNKVFIHSLFVYNLLLLTRV